MEVLACCRDDTKREKVSGTLGLGTRELVERAAAGAVLIGALDFCQKRNKYLRSLNLGHLAAVTIAIVESDWYTP